MMWCSSKRAYGLPGPGATAGFTAAELMLVIVVLGILSSVGIPVIQETHSRYRLQSEAFELVSNFKKAKITAVKHNRSVRIQFTPAAGANNGSYMMYVDVDGDGVFGVSDVQVTSRPLVNNSILVGTTFGNNSTGFDARGMTIALATGRCELRNLTDTRRYRVVLGSTGSVRVESNSGGVSQWFAQ